MNGKETVQGSFLKYTAHELLKKLKAAGASAHYEVNAANKKHEIWQRDSSSAVSVPTPQPSHADAGVFSPESQIYSCNQLISHIMGDHIKVINAILVKAAEE